MRKISLLSPGPTPIAHRTLLAMAQPAMHHRAPEFKQIFQKVRDGLQMVYETQNQVLVFNSSGTGAMESAVANLLSPGDKALVVNGGKFGQRWITLLKTYGCLPVEITVPWGYAVDPALVARALASDDAIKAVYVQALETSTGVEHPIKELAQITARGNAVLVVDAISSLGAYSMPMDAWGIDVMLGASQKALMLPPGLAFVGIGPKAQAMMKSSTLPKFYFSWDKELNSQKDNVGAFTSPVGMFFGMIDVFDMIRAHGLQRIYAETARRSRAFMAAVEAWGLSSYAKQNPSTALSAVQCPAGVDGEAIVKWLREKYSIYIAGGQDEAKGKIFRVAHMGHISVFDTLQAVCAVEMALHGLGYKLSLGCGVAAAQQIFGE